MFLGLDQYAGHFRRHNITGKRLLRLSDANLQQGLGIESFGHRADLLDHIANIARSTEFPPLGLTRSPSADTRDLPAITNVPVVLVARFTHPAEVRRRGRIK